MVISSGAGPMQRPDENGGPMWPSKGGEQLKQGTVIRLLFACLINSCNALYFKTGEDDIPKLLTSLINNKESLIKPDNR